MENMPVGEYRIMVKTNDKDDHEKKNSFELSVKAEYAEVTVAYKNYDFKALEDLRQCIFNSYWCTQKLCDIKEFEYKSKENCNSKGFYAKVDNKDAEEKAKAEKAAKEKKAKEEKEKAEKDAAAKKAAEEKRAAEAAKRAPFKGVGHWFLMSGDSKSYCLQVNGDKVGDEQVTKHFGDLDSLDSFTDSTLT